MQTLKSPLKLFFYWMNERHRIYKAKESGAPWPWTTDKILREYKFTNVYRQLDAVTQEWTKRKQKLRGNKQLLWHAAVFRMFNWPNTYDTLNEAGLVRKWNWKSAAKLLKTSRDRYGNKIFTGAYIITNNGKTDDKIDLCCKALDVLHYDVQLLAAVLPEANSLCLAWNRIKDYPMWGPFTAYELVTDLRWTPMLYNAEDIMTWANAGPGAKRGCNRIFRGSAQNSQGAKYLDEMRLLLKLANEEIESGCELAELDELEMRDIEHSLCEFDKYLRTARNEGRPRSKYIYKGD